MWAESLRDHVQHAKYVQTDLRTMRRGDGFSNMHATCKLVACRVMVEARGHPGTTAEVRRSCTLCVGALTRRRYQQCPAVRQGADAMPRAGRSVAPPLVSRRCCHLAGTPHNPLRLCSCNHVQTSPGDQLLRKDRAPSRAGPAPVSILASVYSQHWRTPTLRSEASRYCSNNFGLRLTDYGTGAHLRCELCTCRVVMIISMTRLMTQSQTPVLGQLSVCHLL